MKFWGIDLGGTKIECAVLDEAHQVIIRKRIPTEAHKGYPHILEQINRLIKEVSTELGERPVCIGFATPGVLSPDTKTMKNCNTVCMNGQSMDKDLETQLGIPVKIANGVTVFHRLCIRR